MYVPIRCGCINITDIIKKECDEAIFICYKGISECFCHMWLWYDDDINDSDSCCLQWYGFQKWTNNRIFRKCDSAYYELFCI